MHSFCRHKFNERNECKICQSHEKEKFSSQKNQFLSFSQVQSTHLQLPAALAPHLLLPIHSQAPKAGRRIVGTLRPNRAPQI